MIGFLVAFFLSLFGIGGAAVAIKTAEHPPQATYLSQASLPLFVLLDESAPTEWDEPLRRCSLAWSPHVVFGGRAQAFSDASGVVSVKVVPREQVSPVPALEWYGSTLQHSRGSDLYSSRILLSRDVPPALREHVCAHELGHALGLDHVGDAFDVMYPYVVRPEYVVHQEVLLFRP